MSSVSQQPQPQLIYAQYQPQQQPKIIYAQQPRHPMNQHHFPNTNAHFNQYSPNKQNQWNNNRPPTNMNMTNKPQSNMNRFNNSNNNRNNLRFSNQNQWNNNRPPKITAPYEKSIQNNASFTVWS